MNLSGLFPGFINGLLGTGGGILAVRLLTHQGASQNEAHATAIGLMLPLSFISLIIQLLRGGSMILHYWPFFFPAAAGSLCGAVLLKKIKPQKLRLLFALLILYSAIRILTS